MAQGSVREVHVPFSGRDRGSDGYLTSYGINSPSWFDRAVGGRLPPA